MNRTTSPTLLAFITALLPAPPVALYAAEQAHLAHAVPPSVNSPTVVRAALLVADADAKAKAAIPTVQPATATAATPAKCAWPAIVDRVRFLPAPGREAAMVGGKFSGSNVSQFAGFQALATIQTAPPRGQWTEIRFANTTPYRWVRYEAPPGSHGNIAELEFYSGESKLRGGGFGSSAPCGRAAPGRRRSMASPRRGSTRTTRTANSSVSIWAIWPPRGNPSSRPTAATFEQPQLVKMVSRAPAAVIRYTLDGSSPGPHDGQLYTVPFRIEKNTTLVAVAFQDGLAPSPPSTTTIWIGKPVRAALHSFHVGNSLTGNASRFRTFIRTAGGRDDFPAYLIGGALTMKLWNESQGADAKRWAETYAKAEHPLDYFTLQPRDFNVGEEADHATRFIKLVREKSPDVQPWLYAEWVEMDRGRPTDKGKVPSFEMKQTFPALTWQESMGAMLLYNEEVEHRIAAQNNAGKPVRIIPTALALGWVRTLIDQGKFPGVSPGEENFYATFFEDQVHVNPAGCYLVACTWYAALYRESPESKLLPIGTGLTSEQSRILQRLAWDIIKNYPDCGLYEDGKQPCAKPEMAINGKAIRLNCATPGAWFRYTLDGATPTRANGYVYTGVISVQPGIRVKAVAYKSGMADSDVAEMPVGYNPGTKAAR